MYQRFGGVRRLCLHGSSLFLDYPKTEQQVFFQEIGNNAPIHAASYTVEAAYYDHFGTGAF